MAQFAVIGWGSLLWDPKDDLTKFGFNRASWREDGPELRLEFARVSQARKGALTLVIDPRGQRCPTYWIAVDLDDWEPVQTILKKREGQIDWVDASDANPSTRQAGRVWRWIQSKPSLTRAVWTSQTSNFTEETGQPFSLANALAYLQRLANTSPDSFACARAYIHQAPANTRTPLRTLFEETWSPRASYPSDKERYM